MLEGFQPSLPRPDMSFLSYPCRNMMLKNICKTGMPVVHVWDIGMLKRRTLHTGSCTVINDYDLLLHQKRYRTGRLVRRRWLGPISTKPLSPLVRIACLIVLVLYRLQSAKSEITRFLGPPLSQLSVSAKAKTYSRYKTFISSQLFQN